MSDKLTDVKEEFLLDQANRRARLLGIVQETLPGYWSLLPATQVITAVMLMLILAQMISRETNLISFVLPLAILLIINIARVAILNKRMDALVELLREDGVLQGTPPVVKLLNRQ